MWELFKRKNKAIYFTLPVSQLLANKNQNKVKILAIVNLIQHLDSDDGLHKNIRIQYDNNNVKIDLFR